MLNAWSRVAGRQVQQRTGQRSSIGRTAAAPIAVGPWLLRGVRPPPMFRVQFARRVHAEARQERSD